MVKAQFLAALLLCTLMPASAWADDVERGSPVDTVQANLFKNKKSASAVKLKKAYDMYASGRYDQAIQASKALLKDSDFSDYAHWLIAVSYRAQAQLAVDNDRPQDAIALGKKALADLIPIESEMPYSPFVHLFAKETALTEIVIARGEKEAGNLKESAHHFENAFERVASGSGAAGGIGEFRPEALGTYAEICSAKIQPSPLCDFWLDRLSSLYPLNSPELKAIAKHYQDARDRNRAPSYSRGTMAYKAPDLDVAAYDAAMLLYLNEKFSDSIPAFKAFLDEYPRSAFRFRARYWLAQAMTHEQKHDEAQKTYEELLHDSPLTYYGLLASIASGKSVESAIDGSFPNAVERDPFMTPEERFRIRRAEWLVTAGADALATNELHEFKPRAALSSEFLMYLCLLNELVNNHNTAFVFLSELIQRGFPGVASSYGLRMIFPLQFMDEIQAQAKDDNLDPILVLSLVKQESAFDPKATSGSGALGLMQLMPSTAVDTDADVIRADLTTVKSNIRVGTTYLKKLLDRFNGNIVLALASYNAGPGAVDRWFKDSPPKRGMLEFIESIPYRETREYVCSIIRNYYWYSKKLNGEAPKSLSHFWNVYGPPQKAPAFQQQNSTADSKT
jgi:TolA-binding protein